MRWGVEQSRNLMTVRAASRSECRRSPIQRASSASVIIQNYLVHCPWRRRHHRLAPGQRLCDPRQPWPFRAAERHRLCRGSQRQGDLPRRQSRAVMGNCDVPDWDGKAMPRRRAGRQAADRPDGGVSDGPYHRRRDHSAAPRTRAERSQATACSARPARPMARPMYGSSAERRTSSLASIWDTTSRDRWATLRRVAESPLRCGRNGRKPR